jgi:glycosyltransferase involved in cell wall biosynthesis
MLQCPLAIDVWRARQVRRVPAGRGGQNVAAYVCSTEPIAASLRDRVGPELVSVVPMGVTVPRDERTIMADPEQSITLAVIGSGRNLPAYQAMLDGLSRVLRDTPTAQVFLELRGPREHEIWRHVQRLELLARISTITDASGHRAALLCCDVLIVPEREGEMRTLLLEAMAGGMAVIAAADPAIDLLVHDRTACIVREEAAQAWQEGLEGVLRDADRARQLGEAARERVVEHYRSSEQVSRLLETFEKALSGGAISFARASS